jgi:integrase
VKRAKVQAIMPHDLRHTCGSISGVNVLAPSRTRGHQPAKVTLDTYADLFDPTWLKSVRMSVGA